MSADKHVISLLIAVMMICSLLPANAYAAQKTNTPVDQPEGVSIKYAHEHSNPHNHEMDATAQKPEQHTEPSVSPRAEEELVASGTCGDNLTWTLVSGGTLTLSGTGNMMTSNSFDVPWRDFRDQITEVVVEKGVTSLGHSAFYDCPELKAVKLPEGLLEIGYYAFSDCVQLDGITLPNTLKKIQRYAFQNCTSLTSIEIPARVTTLPEDAFLGCSNLAGIHVAGDNAYFSSDEKGVLYDADKTQLKVVPKKLAGEYTMPETLETVPSYAFSKCVGLEQVTIPDSVTSIGSHAFSGCTNLKSIRLPAGLTYIGEYMFENCENLTEVTLPDGVEWISQYVFYGCAKLEQLTIPASVTRIEEGAFVFCTNLKSIQLSANLTEIDEYMFFCCKSLTEFVIPDGIVRIGRAAFTGCENLLSVSIPDSVTEIESLAFSECSNLKHINLPSGLTVLDQNVFWYCTSLAEITIPNGVVEILENAFSDCTSLGCVTIPESVQKIWNFAFYNCNSLTNIRYIGTEDEWRSIAIEIGNDDLSKTPIYYNSHAVHAFTPEITEPGCATGGYTTYTCDCGAQYVTDWTEAQWHCYEFSGNVDGYITNTCAVCGSTFTYEYPCDQPALVYNKNFQDYDRWDSVTRSYLEQNADGTFTRVHDGGDRVYIEQYDENLNFLSHAELVNELPPASIYSSSFGGYYNDGIHHFLVFGQNNLEEDDHREVIRVVKYSKDWEHLGSARLYGCDTSVPFYAGSLQMTAVGDTLYVRTCHRMYTSSDGLNHQSNFMFTLRISDMALLSTENLAYVSHSFSQLITTDGEDVIMADHGDAAPRAIQLARNSVEIPVMQITGEIGDNDTGANLGGLGVSDSGYLTTGCSIRQDGTVSFEGQQNIFLTFTSRDDFSKEGTTLRWLTTHADDADVDISTPHLVTVSSKKFCILWTEDDVMHYTFVNGKGEQITEIFKCEQGMLSDCAPICADGRIIWYVCEEGREWCNDRAARFMQFFSISMDDPSTVYVTEAGYETCHSFTRYVSDGNAACTRDGTKTAVCDYCDSTNTVADVGSARGHAFSQWVVVEKPTQTAEGMESRTCHRCDLEETRSIARLETPFSDVPGGSFYSQPVLWAVENGITNGTSADLFSPDDPCMRAHVVTFLWRAMGSPDPIRTDNPFVDVKETDFYYKAVMWAVENGITTGMDATHFGPTAYCNRAQVVTFLYRTMGSPAVESTVNPFVDVAAGSFYEKAVLWAVENGITNGLSATAFGPNSICNRAQIVTFLYRAYH